MSFHATGMLETVDSNSLFFDMCQVAWVEPSPVIWLVVTLGLVFLFVWDCHVFHGNQDGQTRVAMPSNLHVGS